VAILAFEAWRQQTLLIDPILRYAHFNNLPDTPPMDTADEQPPQASDKV